jgi:hypothetical protein
MGMSGVCAIDGRNPARFQGLFLVSGPAESDRPGAGRAIACDSMLPAEAAFVK